MERGESHGSAGPVFVGGTGRCGTHVVASLAARSGRYALVPAELRLHVSPDALLGYAAGARTRRRLLWALRRHWWRHRPAWDPLQLRGVHQLAPRRRYLLALARLAAAPRRAGRTELCRRLVDALLDPLAPRPGAWIEKSPDNCAAGGFLHRVFPELRLIHVVRDGRDVACSFMRVPWAPNDFADALALWERGMLDAHRGTLEVPPGRVHRVLIEDLVWRHRERGYGALLRFCGIPDDPSLRSFFDRELTAKRARIGRWRSDLPSARHAAAEAAYRESLWRLAAAGVGPLPPADAGDEAGQPSRLIRAGRSGSPRTDRRGAGAAAIDPWAVATRRGASPARREPYG